MNDYSRKGREFRPEMIGSSNSGVHGGSRHNPDWRRSQRGGREFEPPAVHQIFSVVQRRQTQLKHRFSGVRRTNAERIRPWREGGGPGSNYALTLGDELSIVEAR